MRTTVYTPPYRLAKFEESLIRNKEELYASHDLLELQVKNKKIA